MPWKPPPPKGHRTREQVMAVKRSALWQRLRREVLVQESTCGRCLRPVDVTLSGDDPWGPTLGCIVPLSRGGAVTRANVQLEHRTCNSRASAW
jgi:5-methylcytosine-specific restriction endonuclease McrA